MAGPLAKLKVLDFTTLLPGPFASMILADLGASVLRVEAPGRPDIVREMKQRAGFVSAAHATVNRSKRCISLDLKNPEALRLVEQLLEGHDILLEQFRPGVMERLGLGYEQLQDRHPGLIYCSLTGYGQTGPYRNRAGHDINYLALSGLSETSQAEFRTCSFRISNGRYRRRFLSHGDGGFGCGDTPATNGRRAIHRFEYDRCRLQHACFVGSRMAQWWGRT